MIGWTFLEGQGQAYLLSSRAAAICASKCSACVSGEDEMMLGDVERVDAVVDAVEGIGG